MRRNPIEHLPTEAQLRQLQLISNQLVESLLAGNYRSVFKGPGIEFDEVREYVEGDDARLIDWNVSSRLNSAFTKTFREEREMTLFLLIDVSRSLEFGSRERSAREVMLLASALLTLAAVQNNDKVGAALFTDRMEAYVQPSKGRRHAMRVLQTILKTQPAGRGSDLARALRTIGESVKHRGICVILSDFHTAGYQKELSIVARRHDVIAVRIGDPLWRELPDAGAVLVTDPETRETMVLNGRSRRFRFEFEQYWRNQRQQWQRECRRRGVSTLELDTTDDVAARLISFFRRRRTS